MKSGVPNNPNACYRYGEVGHYAHQCPKKQNQQAPQNQNGNPKFNARPPHTTKVNYVSSDAAQEMPEVMLGTFSVNSISAIVLFDSGASHSFISQALLECIAYLYVP